MDRRYFCRSLIWTGGGLSVTREILPGVPSTLWRGHSGAQQLENERSRDSQAFLYILRFAMAPGHQEEARTGALLNFCREALIDDVAFILWAEELNTGHPTPQETELWLQMVERVRPRLASIGVTTSLNPWVVLLHADRGRKLKLGQSFQLMVDPYGRTATATACPLCPNLREHLRRHYERLAQVHPRMIWVDDDFRLHNHSPLQWGGCFCDLHMQEYSRRAEQSVTREQFIRGILQPGKPHPYRRVWLETSRETMVDLARLLGQAVHRVSPETKVGLMSSTPSVHCVEGRDWEGVLRGLGAGNVKVNRPHLPSYSEVAAPDYLWNFSRVSRLSAAMVPSETQLYPELENWPHSRFSKSCSFSRFQIESTAALGATGIAMDIFDLFGNGAMHQEGCAPALVAAKRLATRIRELKLTRGCEIGVQVLFSPRASESLWTEKGRSFSELEPDESFWASFLSVMGISHTYREWDDRQPGVLAVSGQYFRGLDKASTRELLARPLVLLNGDAVSTLVQMGMGDALGIRQVEWLASDSGIPSYEQVIDDGEYAGLYGGRLTAQAGTGAYLRVEYGTGAAVHTEVRSPSGDHVGPGMTVIGQRVIVLPYGRGTDYRGLRHPVRQALLQSLLAALSGPDCPVFLQGVANVAVFTYALDAHLVMLLVNSSNDDYEELRIQCPGAWIRDTLEISAEGERSESEAVRVEADTVILRNGLKRLGVKALVLSRT